MSVIDAMRASLAALEPVAIEIIDDSAKHAGHAGALQEFTTFHGCLLGACGFKSKR